MEIAMKLRLLAGSLLLLLFAGGVQADDKPVVALLRYSATATQDLAVQGIFDVLMDYGLVGQHEIEMAEPDSDFYGENITILWRDAGGDITLANAMIEETLDEGAEILLTITTVISDLAVKLTNESGIEPIPLVIFSLVSAPYFSDIADGPCDKPANVVGTHTMRDYDEIMSLLSLFNIEIETIGTYVNQAHPNSVFSSNEIAAWARHHGYETDIQPIVNPADVAIATDVLLDSGVDMIVVGIGSEETRSIPLIVDAAGAFGVPVMSMTPRYASRGAHIAAGFNALYREGVVQGQLLVARLEGRLDAENTSIHSKPHTSVALNLDTMADAGIEITPALLEAADWVILDGKSTEEFVKPDLTGLDEEERRAVDMAFIDSLACS